MMTNKEILMEFANELVVHVLDCKKCKFNLERTHITEDIFAYCHCGKEIKLEHSYRTCGTWEEFNKLAQSIEWLNNNHKEIMIRFPRTEEQLDPILSLEL